MTDGGGVMFLLHLSLLRNSSVHGCALCICQIVTVKEKRDQWTQKKDLSSLQTELVYYIINRAGISEKRNGG